ncbi:MAG: hypothetical protein E6K96_06300 [Thaumarchaeota archaeon]|nr:MAG: hypothetical protein E6K96_06300 [Nitrososphaerota archaeon]
MLTNKANEPVSATLGSLTQFAVESGLLKGETVRFDRDAAMTDVGREALRRKNAARNGSSLRVEEDFIFTLASISVPYIVSGLSRVRSNREDLEPGREAWQAPLGRTPVGR